MKKIFSVILAAVMLLSAAPLGGFVGLDLFGTTASAASYNGTCGDNLTWTLDTETGELVISGEGEMDNYENSSTACAPWFNLRMFIKSVVIAKGVTTIGDYAFYDCKNLTVLEMSDDVTTLGKSAFSNCETLTDLILSQSLTAISGYCFFGCHKLTEITIPDKVAIIEDNAFYYCTELTTITIPSTVTTIGGEAFGHCYQLEEIIIPDGVTTIGNYIFYKCFGLKEITIPDGITSIGKYAFYNCYGLTKVTISDSVTVININAFSGCSELKTVNLGSGIKTIESGSFSDCNNLTDVYYKGSSGQWFNVYIGTGNNSLTNATIHYINFPCDHEYIAVPAKAPTCTEDGRTEGFMCKKCGVSGTTDGLVKVSKLGHDWVEGTPVPVTCTTDGYTPYSCSRCTKTKRENFVKAPGHKYDVKDSKEATCSETGYKKYVCEVCGDTYTDTIPTKKHSYVLTDVVPPTCVVVGFETYTCTMCGDSYSYTISTVNHDYVTTVVAPTCTMIGYTEHKCSVCESYFNTDIVPATGHDMGEWVVLQKGSCTMFELRGRTCLICKTKEFDYIEAPGHDYNKTTVYPTCTEGGYIAHVCSLCGDSYRDSEKPAIGHDFGRWVVLQNGSCTEDEIRERTCSRCKSKETKVIAATDHDYKETETAATCTEEGKTTFTCSKCNDSYETDFVEPLGHLNFEDREVPATCTESGLTKGRHCARCNEVFAEQEVIPATGHRDGNNDGYCDSCNFETDKVLHCSCRCHKTDFFSKIIWFFEKLFGAKNRPCECGASHR